MKHWIKQNLAFVLAVAAIVISLLAIVVSAALSAHAQKPDGKWIEYGPIVVFGQDGCEKFATCRTQLLRVWIKQHCVVGLTEKHTVHHKLNSGVAIPEERMEWDTEVPEETRKLRCQ